MPNGIDVAEMSLEEFVKLPTTVEFHILNTISFQEYATERPYIKVGPELKSGYVPELFITLADTVGFLRAVDATVSVSGS